MAWEKDSVVGVEALSAVRGRAAMGVEPTSPPPAASSSASPCRARACMAAARFSVRPLESSTVMWCARRLSVRS